jgi:hypothetical protein
LLKDAGKVRVVGQEWHQAVLVNMIRIEKKHSDSEPGHSQGQMKKN